MATRYEKFSPFMEDVIEAADKRALQQTGYGLENIFSLSSRGALTPLAMLLKGGWLAFAAVVAVLGIGPLGIAGAFAALIASPMGLVLMGIFGIGTSKALYLLYKNKALPLAVLKVGKEVKPEFEKYRGNHRQIDALLERTSEKLLDEAPRSFLRLLS